MSCTLIRPAFCSGLGTFETQMTNYKRIQGCSVQPGSNDTRLWMLSDLGSACFGQQSPLSKMMMRESITDAGSTSGDSA